MKLRTARRVSLLLTLCLLCAAVPGAHASPEGFSIDVSYITVLAIDNLSTRSGPSTAYSETGTYKVKGQQIRLYSYAFDSNGVCWVQCDIPYNDVYRRLYTGLKRFDATVDDLAALPLEDPMNFTPVRALETATALYGPGLGYGAYGKLTVDRGQRVSLISAIDDFAQVEWTTAKQSYRAWVFAGSLDY